MIGDLFEDCLYLDTETSPLESQLGGLPAAKGLILFADESDRPIQLLIAANIRRTALSRLCSAEPEEPTKRTDISQITRKIYFLVCYNNFKSALFHLNIARKLFGAEYREMVTLPRQSFVKIDTHRRWPFFILTSKVEPGSGEKLFGPFPSRKSAGQFIKSLEQAFGLCRRNDLVDYPQKAQGCPYLQMNACPGPCVGHIDYSRYMEMVNEAIATAGGDVAYAEARMQERMQFFADRMEFEKAQAAKKQLGFLKKLSGQEYHWTGDLSRLAVLHIDKSAKVGVEGKRSKVQTYSGFVFKAGYILEIADFTLEGIGKLCDNVYRQLLIEHEQIDLRILSEQLSLLGYFLYRSTRPGVWIDCRGGLPEPCDIEAVIRDRFNIPPEAKAASDN